MVAAKEGNVEAMKLFLSKGANIEAVDKVLIFKRLICLCVYIAIIPHKYTYLFMQH
jgi:hypothetical protein